MLNGDKIKYALCILALLPQFVFAQHDSTKTATVPLVNVSSGICFSPASAGSGWMDYVKLGYHGGVAADMPLMHSFWGIRASFNYLHNSYDMNKYVADQNAAFPLSTVTSVSYGAFNQFFLMLGAYAEVTCNKLTFSLWAQAGAEYLSLPNFEANYTFKTAQAPYNYTKIYNHALSAAFGAGVEASYRINKKIAATAHLGLLTANVKYTGTAYKDSYAPGITFHLVNGFAESVQVIMLNTSVGLSYYFN